MRPPGSASARFGLFALFALSSLALKAAVGPPRDGSVDTRPGKFERTASDRLEAQHFTVKHRTSPYRSTLLLAERGNCRLAVRDAMKGAAFGPVFAQDAQSTGSVSYLYRGKRYANLPEFTLRLARLEAEALNRFGIHRSTPVLVAFAASRSCGGGDFGMSAISLES